MRRRVLWVLGAILVVVLGIYVTLTFVGHIAGNAIRETEWVWKPVKILWSGCAVTMTKEQVMWSDHAKHLYQIAGMTRGGNAAYRERLCGPQFYEH